MTNRITIGLNVILLSVLACGAAVAQEEGPSTDRDRRRASGSPSSSTGDQEAHQRREREAIRRSAKDFADAFNAGDAKAVARLWAEDGDYIDETGSRFLGRPAIEAEYARFFSMHPGTTMRIIIDSIRVLNDSAAIEDGRAILEPPPAGAPAISKYTAVHVKSNGQWLMSTVRDARIETPSAYRNLEDLEWFTGAWTGEEHGAKMEADCRWIANKSFLERTYSVKHPDQRATSGLQIIGWNPQEGRIQSWNFTPEGGHAVGSWTPIQDGWAVQTTGMLANGTSTGSLNTLTRLGENAYSWKSVERRAGAISLPDTDEIVMRRQAPRNETELAAP